MPDIHVPKLEEHGRGRSTLMVLLEVLLISAGVFLGLAGEQYRETARHREIPGGAAALSYGNHRESAGRRCGEGLPCSAANTVARAFEADAKHEPFGDVNMKGIQPASLDRTAWDLALAQQSLAYIDTDLGMKSRRSTTPRTASRLCRAS